MNCQVLERGPVRLGDGGRCDRHTLDAGGWSLDVLTLGAAISRLEVPDRSGELDNVVLRHGDLANYAGPGREYFGAVVGRVGNRVARGRFALDGREYRLATNDGANHLHGGERGFDRAVWRVVDRGSGESARLRLQLQSPDGEEGYPGTLTATVTYTATPARELRIEYEAVTDAPTLVNLTHHGYFNLAGEGRGDVLAHELTVESEAWCVVDETLIPTGEVRAVDDTPFDFRTPTVIGAALGRPHRQLEIAGGFDHCMALRGWDLGRRELRRAATLADPRSGRRMAVLTDQPGLQFYTGNFLDGSAQGPRGVRYERHHGLCLETQQFPDAPNQPAFPSIVLRPGERYATTTVLRFDV